MVYPFILNCVHPLVQLDYISLLFFPFQLLLFEFIPYPKKHPGTIQDDSDFKMAKQNRILNLLVLQWCVLEQNISTQHLGSGSPVKHKVEQNQTIPLV